MTREDIDKIGAIIQGMREIGDDYIIVSVGARGPNMDCKHGNAVATIRMGNDEETAEALALSTAIDLARGKILRNRELAKKAKEKSND